MASKRSEVAELNRIVSEFLERLGMSEEAKLEFKIKADSMISLDSHRSGWFNRITAQLSQILHQIHLPRPDDIDLNEPPPSQHTKVGEEGGSSSRGKRKKATADSTALRIRESNVRALHEHNNQVPLLLLSDSDSDSIGLPLKP